MRFVKRMTLNSLRLKVLLAYLAGMVLSITLLVIAAAVMLQSDLLPRMDLADAAEGWRTISSSTVVAGPSVSTPA